MTENYLEVKNLDHYQHYKDRHLVWIKWYIKDIDKVFDSLPAGSKWLYVGLIGIACKCNNQVCYDIDWLHKELAYKESVKDFKVYLDTLIDSKLIAIVYTNNILTGYTDKIYKQDIRIEDIPAIIPIELKGLKLYETDKKLIERWDEVFPAWQTAYPGVNIAAEVCKAHAWELSNPTRKKIDRARFLRGWLSRCQDSPRTGQPGAAPRTGGAFEQSVAEPKCDFCHNPAPTPVFWRNVTSKVEIELITAKWLAMAPTESLCSACMEKLNEWLKKQKPPVQSTGKGLEPAGKTANEVLATIKQPA